MLLYKKVPVKEVKFKLHLHSSYVLKEQSTWNSCLFDSLSYRFANPFKNDTPDKECLCDIAENSIFKEEYFLFIKCENNTLYLLGRIIIYH
ncbi:hypothetical protein TUBRATIS_22960 [Tubulinosema ratisbonensis]|uniref:Uncharacterized protein n=1 Tax=Tubulinosema ratisbonensis TaxID=291195 RepID=A0A437AJI1_9MICR|nr:hypothetical protein TUBRATIS_22960 [Tubulinosema ratisbonensis]